jgi:hypothetical protein
VRRSEKSITAPAVGGEHALGGQRRLVHDLVEHQGLHQLGLGERRGHLQQRFAGEHDPTLRDRPDLPGELQPTQRCEVSHGPAERGGESGQVVLVDGEPVEVIEHVGEPGGDE